MRAGPALAKRYRTLVVPPEFARATVLWPDALPEHAPLPLTRHVGFRIAKVLPVPTGSACGVCCRSSSITCPRAGESAVQGTQWYCIVYLIKSHE